MGVCECCRQAPGNVVGWQGLWEGWQTSHVKVSRCYGKAGRSLSALMEAQTAWWKLWEGREHCGQVDVTIEYKVVV